MSFPKSYADGAPYDLAEAIDLTSADWSAPVEGINEALPQATSGIYVGGAGDLNVVMVGDGGTVTFKAHAAGYAPLKVVKVFKSGTTATNLIALF